MPEPRSAGHLNEDELALAALGEPLGSALTEHSAECPVCAARIAALSEVVALAKAPVVDHVDPPGGVWRAIAAELPTTTAAGTGVTGLAERRPSRRPRRLLALAAAAVAGAVVGGGAVSAVLAGPQMSDVVATAQLGPLPEGPAGPQTGAAAISYAGARGALEVSTRDLASPAGFYEVWLLDVGTGGMIAMGTVPSGSAKVSLPVPPGVDLARYRTVDISDEPFDGNPGHSAVSVLRGGLTA